MTQFIFSFLLATVYGLSSYFRNHKEEEFDIKAFVKTVIIGVLVGAAMYSQHLGYEAGFAFITTNGFIMMLVDMLINNIFQWKPKLKAPRKLY